jgi:hypothetical protein
MDPYIIDISFRKEGLPKQAEKKKSYFLLAMGFDE